MKVISLTVITLTVYLALSHMLPFSGASVPQTSGIEQADLAAAAVADSAAIDQAAAVGGNEVQRSMEEVKKEILPLDGAQVEPAPQETSVPVSAVAQVVEVNVEQAALAAAPEAQLALAPELESFISTVVNGQPETVVGVYVPGVLALPVIQQPNGQASYVSERGDVVTQFAMPAAHGTVGLLAHNYLSGRYFFNLSEGIDAYVIYGDGRIDTYRITRMQSYQALNPTSVYSNFVDVDDPNQTVISAGQMFNTIYTTPDQLVFQTCIDAHGDPSWGRLFVTAQKLQ